MLKKVSRLLLALILFVPFTMLSGCSSQDDGVELMKEVNKVMKQVDSMKMNMNYVLDMGIKVGSDILSVGVDMDMDAEFSNDPIKGHASTEMITNTMGSEEKRSVEMYMLEKDGEIVSIENDGTGYVLSENSIPMDNASSLYTLSDEDLENMDIKVSDGEKINGKDTYKVNLTIDGKKMSNILSSTLEESPLSNAAMDNMDFKYTLFVDKDSKEVLKVSLDLKDQVKKIMDGILESDSFSQSLPEGMEISINKFKIEIFISDFNKIEDIDIPKEALELANINEDENTEEKVKKEI